MADLTATPDELIAVFRELFSREHEIAFLTLANRNRPSGSPSSRRLLRQNETARRA
jgi:hypothetical protein